MASARGILNIQSLNELTSRSDNASRVRGLSRAPRLSMQGVDAVVQCKRSAPDHSTFRGTGNQDMRSHARNGSSHALTRHARSKAHAPYGAPRHVDHAPRARARLHPAPTCNSYDHISHAAADTPHALDDQIEPSSRLRRRASVQECALVDLKSRATCSCRGPSRGAPPWRARSRDSPWHTSASPPSL